MSAVGVGLIGSGVISDTYLENLRSFPDVEVVNVGGLDVGRARARAEKHGVPRWGTADDVLADPEVQVVVNLTTPAAHVEVSAAAIAAGKHVWTEKPIGLERDGVDALLRSAEAAGLRVGSAPDTVLGPGFQTAKRAIESGVIGAPLFAHTSCQSQGPDLWHPGPQFLFSRGAGPLLDMGPYYFTALDSLLGPGDSVAAGTLLGRLGSSGNSTEPHLHFHVCRGSSALQCSGVPVSFSNIKVLWAETDRALQSGDIVIAK